MIEYPHQVTVLNSERVRDPNSGEFTQDWVEFKQVAEAFVDPISGTELIRAMQSDAKMDYRVFIPYELSEGITKDMRLKWRDTKLEVVGNPRNLAGYDEVVEISARDVT